jgi:hypothetical protein
LHKNQRLPPPVPNPPQNQPEHFVGTSEPRLRTPQFQNGQLLAKRQVFEKNFAARAKRSSKEADQEPQHAEHESSFSREQSNLDIRFIYLI